MIDVRFTGVRNRRPENSIMQHTQLQCETLINNSNECSGDEINSNSKMQLPGSPCFNRSGLRIRHHNLCELIRLAAGQTSRSNLLLIHSKNSFLKILLLFINIIYNYYEASYRFPV